MNVHCRSGYGLWLGAVLLIGLLAACGGSSSGTASGGVSTATSAATGGTAAAGGVTSSSATASRGSAVTGVTSGSATASMGSAVAGSAGTPAAATGDVTTVKVIAKDFSFSLDKSTVPAGTVTFVMTNQGPSAHNFAIMGNGVNQTSDTIAMGAQTSLTVTLMPGTYPYLCTVPGHEQLGMKGTLTVK